MQSQITSGINLGQNHALEASKNSEDGEKLNKQSSLQIEDLTNRSSKLSQNHLEDSQEPHNLSPEGFLQLKKQDAFDAKNIELESSGKRKESPSEIEESGKGKKKKKMKIRVGDVGSNRILFDQEGRALNPLEALAEESER